MLDKLMDRVSPEPNTGCWLWTGRTLNTGYGSFHLGNQKYASAHRASYEAHVGPIPDGQCVCHRCDVRSCVNPDHLFLGTHADNMRDCKEKGRNVIGSRNGRAKLTAEQVREIRASSAPQTKLSAEFGVSAATISEIKSRKKWNHV